MFNVVGHLQVLIYLDKYNLVPYGITFHEHNHIFRVYTFTEIRIHRLHEEKQHTYRTKASRLIYNLFKLLLMTLKRALVSGVTRDN